MEDFKRPPGDKTNKFKYLVGICITVLIGVMIYFFMHDGTTVEALSTNPAFNHDYEKTEETKPLGAGHASEVWRV